MGQGLILLFVGKEDKKKHQAVHYYLFGYPEEPGSTKARKYFRSPNNFMPHLLWLIGDSQDRGDCACEFCSGSKPITSKSAKPKPASSAGRAPSPVSTSVAPSTSTKIATNNANAAGNTNATVAVNSGVPTQKVTTSGALNTKSRQVNHPSPVSQQPPTREAHTPSPYQVSEVASSVAQRPYPIAQDQDALFRAGEVVWFKNNNSWRVGMILTANTTLSIIPFGHPLYPTQEVIKEEIDIRPFLAFSIPQINNALQEFRGQALAQIDWHSLQERFGTRDEPSRQEGLAIEATKLAALRVDQCYSIFNTIYESAQDGGSFGGIFLGAEKICVGEAVRIKISREQQGQVTEKGMPTVLVINRIFGREGILSFEGSLWSLQHATLAQQPQTPNQAQLPVAMLGEKEFRDGILQPRGWRVEWVLINQKISVNETSIRGRFYETRRLTPILNPAKFQEMLQQQHIDDIQTLLNNRADSNGPHVGRVLNRAQAVAGAVPEGVPGSLGPDVTEA
jgi:hypothetical protein